MWTCKGTQAQVKTVLLLHLSLCSLEAAVALPVRLPAQRAAGHAAAKCSPLPSVSLHTDLFLPGAGEATLKADKNKTREIVPTEYIEGWLTT